MSKINLNLDFWQEIDSTNYGIVGPVGNRGELNLSLKERLELQKNIILYADKKEWTSVGFMLQDLDEIENIERLKECILFQV